MDLQLHPTNAKNSNQPLWWQKVQRNAKQNRQQQLQHLRILPRSFDCVPHHLLAANPSNVLLSSVHQSCHFSLNNAALSSGSPDRTGQLPIPPSLAGR